MSTGEHPLSLEQLYWLFKHHIYVDGTGAQAQVRIEPAPDPDGSGSLSPEQAKLLNNLATQIGGFGHLVAATIAQVNASRDLAVALKEVFREAGL